MLAELQVKSLYQRCIKGPTPFGQDRFDGRGRAKDDAVFDSDDTPAPVALDDLHVEQPGQRHPAQFGLRPFVMVALGLNPLAIVGHQGSEVLAKPISVQCDSSTRVT